MHHFSKNPIDYIFAICDGDFGLYAGITPLMYFIQYKCMDDQENKIKINGWNQDMEGMFSCQKNLSIKEMHEDLVSQGFNFSEDLACFLDGIGGTLCYRPEEMVTELLDENGQVTDTMSLDDTLALFCPAKPAALVPPPGTKINTAVLKQFCADYFKNNPGVLAREYDPEDAKEMNLLALEKELANPKAWKRVEKTKDTTWDPELKKTLKWKTGEKCPWGVPSWHRAFYVKNFALLEKHGYCDEDAVKMYIYTDRNDTRILSFSLEVH